MKPTPLACERGGRAGMPAGRLPVRSPSWSSRKRSERCPSTAKLRAEPARNWSLKISSDSAPS